MEIKLRHTFSKNERLSSRLLIEALMLRSNPSFLMHPVLFTWMRQELSPGLRAQVLISVSKKKFKRAVDRNLVKRLLRESYRLNKHLLYQAMQDKQLLLHINYIASDIRAFAEVQESIIKGLKRIANDINKV